MGEGGEKEAGLPNNLLKCGEAIHLTDWFILKHAGKRKVNQEGSTKCAQGGGPVESQGKERGKGAKMVLGEPDVRTLHGKVEESIQGGEGMTGIQIGRGG